MMGDMNSGDGLSEYCAEVNIAGFQCLEWKFQCLPDDKHDAERERAKRRKLKDLIGSENLDMPMLDTKNGKHGKEYCDILVLTEHLSEWEESMRNYYTTKGYHHEKRTHRVNGTLTTWFDGTTPVISVTMWPNKGKFMVQPGEKNPERLIEWITECGNFKDSFPRVSDEDEEDAVDDSAASSLSPVLPPHSNDISVVPRTPTAPTETPLTPTAPTEELITAQGEVPQPVQPEGTPPGVNACTKLAIDVRTILQTVQSLSSVVKKLSDKVDKNNEAHIKELSTANKNLKQENATLRKSVAELTLKVTNMTWKSFRDPQQKSQLLIGSSIIRDVDEDKLSDTEVICKRGGTIETIKQEVDKLNNGYDNITVVVGGNDCDSKSPIDAATIVQSYSDLLDSISSKASHVTVSSICPRLTSERTQETIEAVNAGLLATCSDKPDITYIDSTPSFKLGDGSVNDGYIYTDGIHITRPAMNKIAKNMKLKVKDQAEGVCRKVSPKHQPNNVKVKATTNPKTQDADTTDRNQGQWTTQQSHAWKSNRNYRPSHARGGYDIRCDFCAETGHSRDKCLHGKPIQCRKCQQFGHKQKFCEVFSTA